jgi:hypothetical protein
VCSSILQQMIEVVPAGVTLSSPIVVYDVKPYALQLTLLNGGTLVSFTGEIRVRTTVVPASQIVSVQLVFMDGNGGSNCGTGGCSISSTYEGSSAGLDDSFVVSFIRCMSLITTSLMRSGSSIHFPPGFRRARQFRPST